MEAGEFRDLAERFLAMLTNQRGASEHTVRAYAREIRSFAVYLSESLGASAGIASVEHHAHPLVSWSAVRARVDEGKRGAGAGCGAELVPMAGEGAAGGTESGAAGEHTEASEASAARSERGGGQSGVELPGGTLEAEAGKRRSGRGRAYCVAGAGTGDLRAALWLRDSQLRAGGAEYGQREVGRRGDPGAGQGTEGAAGSAGRRGRGSAAELSSGPCGEAERCRQRGAGARGTSADESADARRLQADDAKRGTDCEGDRAEPGA